MYYEPLVKLQTLRVTLISGLSWNSHAIYFILLPDNEVTVTTHTWSVNLSRQTSGISRNFVVHGLCCCYRQRKCCSDLPSVKLCCARRCMKKNDVHKITPLYILVYCNQLPSSHWIQTLPDNNLVFCNHVSWKKVFLMFSTLVHFLKL